MAIDGKTIISSVKALEASAPVGKKIFLESGGFLVAEAVSIAAGLGVVAVADMVIPKSVMKYGSQVLGKAVVEPFLDNIEWFTSKICKLEECRVDETKSREERAEKIARIGIVFGTAYVVSMGAKLVTRRMWNDHYGFKEERPANIDHKEVGTWNWLKHHATFQNVSAHEKMIFLADEGVHYASLYTLNNQLAPFTENMIHKTSDVIQKTTGFDEGKSHEIASMAWMWDAANVLGAAAGIAVIAGAHGKGWPNGWVGKVLANKPRTDLSHVKMLEERAAEAATSLVHIR